ncbi:MAG: cysteine--tRNA ligase, partial [Bacteroidales bacterium]|nr:cysteine--tRNA ligase [Bacteroidales bacterium]
NKLKEKCYKAINDDLNTPVLISHLFDGVKMINSINDGKEKISADDLDDMKGLYNLFVYDVLGLEGVEADEKDDELTGKVIETLLSIRHEAKNNKDWKTADRIRDELSALGIIIKDTKDGANWEKS